MLFVQFCIGCSSCCTDSCESYFTIKWAELYWCRVVEELHQALKLLSAELYSKDVHFIMELIHLITTIPLISIHRWNLSLLLTKDVAGVSVDATLLVFNNEIRFLKWNIDYLHIVVYEVMVKLDYFKLGVVIKFKYEKHATNCQVITTIIQAWSGH